MSSLALYKTAIKTQVRVISALILRETRVAYGASSLGYFWAIAEPVVGTTLMVLIFSAISRTPAIGTNFALFFATGMLIFTTWRQLTSKLMIVFDATKGLLAYPLVNTTDVVVARGILLIITNLIVILLFFSFLVMFLDAPLPAKLEQVLLAFWATVLLGFAGGLLNAVLMALWPTWKQLEGIISRPMFFISGIFFIPTNFPPSAQYWLSWNPLLHCIEWFREGYYGYYSSQVLDKNYLFSCIGVFMVLALGSERLYRKRIT